MKRFKEFLTEMEKLPRLVTDEFGEFVKMNAAARQRRAANITYIDDKRFNDHKGKLWLDVKHKDYYTIAAAVLTGMYDVGRIKEVNIDEITASKEAIRTFLHSSQYAKALVTKVWNFLKQYMSKGTVTVYRGITLTNVLADLIKKDKFILYNPARILQYVDNTTKEFNSFSVNKSVSQSFATDYHSEDNRSYILFSAEVDNNDVNWTFTAYLMGRHGGVGESELNINNLKRLKNVKVIDCYLNGVARVMQNQVILHNISSAIQKAFTLTSDEEIADKLREITQYSIQFHELANDNIFEEFNNWRIMRIAYTMPNNNVNKFDNEYDDYDIMDIAYNVKTKAFLQGASIAAQGNCLLITKDMFSNEGSIYAYDDNKPIAEFINYKRTDDSWFTTKSNIFIITLQDNMSALFDCDTGKYVHSVKYYNIIRDQDLTDEDNQDLYKSLKFSLGSDLHGVICTDEHNNVVAVYAKHDKYRRPISVNVLNGGYNIQRICKAKGKTAYYVVPRDNKYYVNGEIRDVAYQKLVDDNNNTLLTGVHEIYTAANGQSFATVIVDTSDTYYKFKLVDLNALQYVSNTVFNDIVSYIAFTRRMNEFVVLERLQPNSEQFEYNILINQYGAYTLAFNTWAKRKRHFVNYIQFDFDYYSMTYNMQTRQLVKGTVEDLQLANRE